MWKLDEKPLVPSGNRRFLYGCWPVVEDLRNHPVFDPVAHYAEEMKRQYELAPGEQFGEGLVDWERTTQDSQVWWLHIRIPIVRET